MTQIIETYGNDVKVAICMNALPFHKRAMPAAKAALAANLQGKYFEYEKVLWDNMKALEDADLEKYAGQAGLDVAQWKKDKDSKSVEAQAVHQQNLADALGARGTPGFFINGENLRGAQPFEKFKEVIDRQLAAAKAAEGEGTAVKDLHAKLAAAAVGGKYKQFVLDGNKPPKPQPRKQQPPREPLAKEAMEIPIGDSPRKGKGDKVVITEFSDFQ